MTVGASPEQIGAVMDFVNGQRVEFGCTEGVRIDVDAAADELPGNIIRYACGSGNGTVTARVEPQEKPPAVILTFPDQGVPFDPPAEETPDPTSLPARERPAGRPGLFMARSPADERACARRDCRNVPTVRKAI